MKRAIIILTGLLVFLSANLVLFTRYKIVANEGYPIWEATRNFLIRSGEIKIQFPDNVEILSAHCDDPKGTVRTKGQTVITKIGNSWSIVEVRAQSEDGGFTYFFNSRKPNSWDRIYYFPIDPGNPSSKFIKIENGIEKSHTDVIREANPN